MQTHDIPGRLAEAATSKLLWAQAQVNTPESDRYLRLAAEAENAVIGTPAADNAQIIAKLALALDWASEWSTPSFRALIQSAIADLEGPEAFEPPAPPAPEPRTPGTVRRAATARPLLSPPIAPTSASTRQRKAAPAPKPAPAPVEPVSGPIEAVWLNMDRRSRPCVVNHVLYPSIAEACRKTGLSASQVTAVLQPA